MSEPRFTVKRGRQWLGPGTPRVVGWVVFDRGHPITIAFQDYGEALMRRDNIAAIYARFGWS
jgi:hypothetical protein